MIFKRNNFNIIVAALLCVVLGGCATSAGRKPVSGAEDKKAVKLDRKYYIPLSSVCNDYDLTWEWDGFSRIINKKKYNIDIKMYPGSAVTLYNNQVYQLDAAVQIYDGAIMVPASFTKIFFKEKKTVSLPVEKKEELFSIKKVVIDAGHGGKDPGAVGKGDVLEKEINLDIAKRLKEELEAEGIQVILTRDTDIFHPLEKRPEIANSAGADFFISIHSNASKSSSASGFEAYYLSTNYDDFSKAVQLRENAAISFEKNTDYQYSTNLNATLWDMILNENRIESVEMANAIAKSLQRMLKLQTRYVRGAMFYVLKGARMPAVLLEVGYLSNPTEASRLNNAYYRQMLAESIASGIAQYKKEFEMNNGFSK
ncbi:MAG: N-acetylmuramoyl-L-alanine amidase [Candidatus Omnitrophica bacterium]|nr:N-acetylmuramoyl-L-alanine amidase [Candidatus Omnitrophota bacterium]